MDDLLANIKDKGNESCESECSVHSSELSESESDEGDYKPNPNFKVDAVDSN